MDGLSFLDTFSHVAKITTVLHILALATRGVLIHFAIGLSTNLLKMHFFMGSWRRRFTWSNLLGLLLRGSLV
uniref:Uncharacterized protein n=1 Tax=Cajanus cajan TaxID=3821 RepID=A0A151SGR5_CAJCA|nr:hypothetical protein KK1_000103 [Cajanus cajan]